jgi:phage terminase large subunit-like protein
MIDMDLVEDAVHALCDRYAVRELAYDKRFAAHLVQHLEGAGLTCIDTPQGFQLHEAITTLERLVSEGNLVHGGNPILAWQADNFVTRRGRQGEKRPDKPSAKDKIDAVVALTMAIDRVIRRPTSTSVYESQGIRTL